MKKKSWRTTLQCLMIRLLRFLVALPIALIGLFVLLIATLIGLFVVLIATLFVWIGFYLVDFANWLNEHE